ncbi:MAG TPA: iron-containing alcohol dehydrogenase [Blastocatellia bacterium]|nr:iron-containing alcohol dehydrogenase [Blastocatellia bacterium]
MASRWLYLDFVSSRREIHYPVGLPTPRPVFDLDNDLITDLLGSRQVLVTVDAAVDDLYGDQIRGYFGSKTDTAGYLVIASGELNKSWDQVARVCGVALDSELRRDAVIVAVGGGVVMDIVGFASSIYRRGVSYLRVPTTLVGLVDVGVGLKNGINFQGRKNILGAFHPPLGTITDLRFLRTLDEREIACGIAEMIKIALVKDDKLFDLLERSASTLMESKFQVPGDVATMIIARAQRALKEEIELNPLELDHRRLVDFGHTFSPDMETKSGYLLRHGEAVALDMILSTFIAVRRMLCPEDVIVRLKRLYGRVGLPQSQAVCGVNDLAGALDRARAHRGGKLNLVVPVRVGGGTFIQDVEIRELEEALAYARDCR